VSAGRLSGFSVNSPSPHRACCFIRAESPEILCRSPQSETWTASRPDGVNRAGDGVTDRGHDLAGQTTAETSTSHIGRDDPRWHFNGFLVEKRRCWGSISVDIVYRAAGESISRSDYHQLTYFLTGFHATMEDEKKSEWESDLLCDNFVFRPPDTTLRSNLTAGRYIHVLQRQDTYDQLAEMMPGGVVHLAAKYNLNDPLISQLVSTIANEMEGGFLDQILADALNTALAVQIIRLCSDPTAITLEPSNGLSGERLKRVFDYIEAHLNDRLALADLAGVACLSPYHFSRSFKQAVGMGPQRYVMHRRVERAKALIRRTHQPLALIAQEAGFADQSHLTSVFRREIGVTPGHFRAALT
jgi:AraC-like DNA-binding protein